MGQEACAFTIEALIDKVISKNIPPAWNVQYRLVKLHLKNELMTSSAI